MMRRAVVLLALALAGGAGASAQQDAPLLVSTSWLAEHLRDPNLVVLHVGSDESYAEAHIPGARHMALAAFAPERNGLSTEVPELDVLQNALENAGITNESRVIIYAATHPPQLAARLYVTLDYIGLGKRASLLDGGLRAWRTEQRELSTEAVQSAPGRVTLQLREGVIVDHVYVNERLDKRDVAIVDARDERFWSGAMRNQARAARAGRIPGARNLPYGSLVDESGRLLERSALVALFRQAGIAEGQSIVTYCHVGQQASLLFLAARQLGHDVRMYDGSYEDWSKRPELRVETGSR